MKSEERERLVDSVLDRALGPRLVEPRPGLEERILANLPKEAPRPWWQWMWIPALAAAAVLAVVIGMRFMHREAPAPIEAKQTIEQPKQEVAVNPEAPAVEATHPRRENAKRVAPSVVEPKVQIARATPPQDLPRQSAFPAPLPLTEQERLLLALVNRQRPQAELVASEQQAEREKIQKYVETGDAPVAQPIPAQPMR